MLASLLFIVLSLLAARSSSTVWAASPSSSFGISSPLPLVAEALSLTDGAAGWNKNGTGDRSSPSTSGYMYSIPPTSMTIASGTTMRTTVKATSTSAEALCDKLHLTPRQKQMCVQGGDGLAETLLEAIRMSALTCQQQFEYERWNCSLQGYSRLLTLKKAYRETAVLYAFSAAGVVHAVARACAAGRLRKCHCAEAENEVETRQTWRWGGCGDNLAYAKAFAKKFLDAGPSTSSSSKQRNGKSNADEREEGGGKGDGQKSSIVSGKPKKKKKKASIHNEMEALSRALRKGKRSMSNNALVVGSNGRRGSPPSLWDASVMNDGSSISKKHKSESQRQRINRHNNAVGIQVVEQLVNRTCKCHGVSGSCSVRTCWHQLAAFSETGAVVKSKYDSAVQVTSEIRENSSHLRPISNRHATTAQRDHLNEALLSNQPVSQNRAKKATEEPHLPAVAMTSAADRVKSKKEQLIFQQKSPDFCSRSQLGPGTVDRVCQRGDNCDILCCGRGYNVHKMTVMTPCSCKLILCCRVECDNCLVEKTIYTCK